MPSCSSRAGAAALALACVLAFTTGARGDGGAAEPREPMEAMSGGGEEAVVPTAAHGAAHARALLDLGINDVEAAVSRLAEAKRDALEYANKCVLTHSRSNEESHVCVRLNSCDSGRQLRPFYTTCARSSVALRVSPRRNRAAADVVPDVAEADPVPAFDDEDGTFAAAAAPGGGFPAGAKLVHFSAQQKRFVRDRECT
jgi:hypothetical protein